MTKMTDVLHTILKAAAQRDDGAAIVSGLMSKSARLKVGVSLVSRKLMREIHQKGDMPVWRISEEGKNISLVLTRAGRDAVRIAEDKIDKITEAT